MAEYPLMAIVGVLASLLFAHRLQPGLLSSRPFWLTVVIAFAFQIFVDGWLTKSTSPIVIYDDRETLGIRVAWNTPIEDFLFAFAMITITLTLWNRIKQ